MTSQSRPTSLQTRVSFTCAWPRPVLLGGRKLSRAGGRGEGREEWQCREVCTLSPAPSISLTTRGREWGAWLGEHLTTRSCLMTGPLTTCVGLSAVPCRPRELL